MILVGFNGPESAWEMNREERGQLNSSLLLFQFSLSLSVSHTLSSLLTAFLSFSQVWPELIWR